MKALPVWLFALLMLGGCATTERIRLQPVDYGIPARLPGTYDPSQLTTQPIPVKQSAPRYPLELRRGGVSGEATVIYTVRADGTVGDVAIVKADDIRLGQAAANAIAQWRFRPAQLDGVPVNCRLMMPIVFSLNED